MCKHSSTKTRATRYRLQLINIVPITYILTKLKEFGKTLCNLK